MLSYLPLSHVAERLLSTIDALHAGYVVNFGEAGESFAVDLREIQPTFFLGVPRVWEKMLATVEIRVRGRVAAEAADLPRGHGTGSQAGAQADAGSAGTARPARGRLLWWLVLFRSLREKLGLSRIRVAVSGAAPIAPKVLEYFWALGVPVREGYGQTEGTALATYTPADDVRIGKVGKALPGVELRIADDGEILVRSKGVFVGYLDNPAATAETIDGDGWLHTGDVGELDDDGFLTITDRKKDIIITAGGKNISPSEIENMLKVSPYVREAIVIGDRRKYLTALIGIEADTVGNWATRKGIGYTTYRDLSAQPEVKALVADVVDGRQPRAGPGRDDQAVRAAAQGARPRRRRADRDPEGQAGRHRHRVRRAHRDDVRLVKLFTQLVVSGFAQGALYALVALGFVVIYKATDVINFAQGALVLLGAYFCFTFNGQWGWPFYPSVLAAMAAAAVLGLALERLILRRMIGQPNYAVIMITIGLSIAIDQIVIWKWTGSQRNFGDPWGLDTYEIGGVVIPVVNVVQIVVAGAVLLGFFALFRYSRVGIAMRATASTRRPRWPRASASSVCSV